MNRYLKIMTIIVIVAVGILGTVVFAQSLASEWNRGNWWSYLDGTHTGYVQCRPSYVEFGQWRAARGYFQLYQKDAYGSFIANSGIVYTEWGTGPNDSRVLSRTKPIYGTMNINHPITFWYDFVRVPVGNQWPLSVPND